MPLVNLNAFAGEKIHNTVDPKWELGSIAIMGDHVYRYVKAGTALTAGSLATTLPIAAVANITGFRNTADENTGKWVYIEDSSETMTENIYAGLYVTISTGTAVGLQKRIRSNTATRLMNPHASLKSTKLNVRVMA